MLVSYTYPDNLEAATCSVREGVLASNFTKKEALAQVLSCESGEISKNTLFLEHLLLTPPPSFFRTPSPLLDCF